MDNYDVIPQAAATSSVATATSLVSANYNIEEAQRLARLYVASGFFQDVKDIAQAFVKIQAGAELGLSPITSMTEVYIVKGRVSLSARGMATVAAKGGYEFRVPGHTDEYCNIQFYRNGVMIGSSAFSMDDAKRAGLSGDNWKKYPRNMLWARAMSNGCKWFCADAFGGGSVYTPEEATEFESVESARIETSPKSPTAALNQVLEAPQREGSGELAPPGAKQKVAEHVTLTDEEWQKLCEEHGESKAYELIQILDNYKGQNGKRYKSDYRAICNWVVKRYEEDHAKESKAERQARIFEELDEITSDEESVVESDEGAVQAVAFKGS